MIGAVVSGTLVADPVERTTREGKSFTTATLRVPAGEDALFVGVAAFGETAAARLAQMSKGGTVAACGVLEVNAWTTKEGETRSGWRMTANEIMSVYQARKRSRRSDDEGDADA